MKRLRVNKPLLTLLFLCFSFIVYHSFQTKNFIDLEPSSPVYVGKWESYRNASSATVSVRDGESYDIFYKGRVCSLAFQGEIYTIDVEAQFYQVLKLDIDRSQSDCHFLNTFFAPGKFIFKIEALTPEYAKLRLPSMADIELFMQYAEGEKAVMENIEGMVRLLKTKSSLLQELEKVVLEYEKEQ